MKYIIDEAMERAEVENRIKPASMIQSDEELVAVLEELTTVIRVIGCGGGGSNTIDRLAECGIQGAELFASLPIGVLVIDHLGKPGQLLPVNITGGGVNVLLDEGDDPTGLSSPAKV